MYSKLVFLPEFTPEYYKYIPVIKLNYAESLLWDKQFDVAENYYEKLIKENDKSFSALLGYANTLSNLKKSDMDLCIIFIIYVRDFNKNTNLLLLPLSLN